MQFKSPKYVSDDFLRLIFPQYIKETVFEVFYSRVGQRISVANYWNDPHHQELYYKSVYYNLCIVC